MIIYLDLDRTLFDTQKSEEIWRFISKLHPEIDAKTAYEQRDKYYVTVGDQYFHDMSAQLTGLGLDPETVYTELRRTELADGRFEFPGSKELIESLSKHADVQIFTFGMDDYQRFKVSLCPSLKELTVTTMLRSKAEVLDDMETECWLVDDKPIGDELPSSVSFVQVELEGKDIDEYAEAWPIFRSLGQVREFFEDIFLDQDIDK